MVEDLDRSIAFYTDVVGLTLGHRSGPYAQFDTGMCRLALYQRDAMDDLVGPGERFEIGFKVDDVDAAFAAMVAAGADAVVEPETRPWGQRTAYVRDPDGHLVELAQDLGT